MLCLSQTNIFALYLDDLSRFVSAKIKIFKNFNHQWSVIPIFKKSVSLVIYRIVKYKINFSYVSPDWPNAWLRKVAKILRFQFYCS